MWCSGYTIRSRLVFNIIFIHLLFPGGKKKPLKTPKKQSKELDDVSVLMPSEIRLLIHHNMTIIFFHKIG